EVPGGSVRQRLAERWKFKFDAPPLGIPADQKLQDYFSLADNDFAQAREYLAQEIQAFARSQTVQNDPTGQTPTYQPFVGTSQPPGPVPEAFYPALARLTTSQGIFGTPPLAPASTNNLALEVDAVYSAAIAIIRNQDSLDAEIRAGVTNPLVTLIA